MRIRIVLSGIAAGLICLVALWFPYYMLEPSKFVADWPYASQIALFPNWFSTAVLIFCGLTIFAFGWVAARWNWSDTWRASLLSGSGVGLIAGCLVFDFIGVFWFGLKGQEEIFKNTSSPLAEMDGIRILVNVVTQTAESLYLNFVLIVIGSVMLGALGGLVSVIDAKDFWGRSPRTPSGWLFRLPAYSLVLTGCLNLMVTIAVLQILSEKTVDAAVRSNLQKGGTLPPQIIFVLGYFVGLAMTLMPAFVTWGWLIRGWRKAGSVRIFSFIWLSATLIAAVYYVFSRMLSGAVFLGLPSVVIGLIGFILVGVLLGLISEDKYSQESPYRFSDWLGYGLTQGILGGTQIIMGVLAYAISLSLIAIVNIPHLTSSGVVDQATKDQIITLFNIQSVSAEAAILVSLFGGLIFATVIGLIRKIFRIQSRVPLERTASSPLA